MDGIEEKADEMLRSPLGCAFLSAAAASGLTPVEITSAPNCIYFAAYARKDIEVWQPDYQLIRDEILREGRQHRDLAVAILDQPSAADWFGPLDTGQQVYVPYERDKRAPEPGMFESSSSKLAELERHSRYSEMWFGGMLTSTLVGGTAGWFTGLDMRVGDMVLANDNQSAYEWWLVSGESSARVYEVDGPQAWHDLCVQYPAEGRMDSQPPDFSGDPGRLVPDWPAIAEDWDAVHLTFGGLLTAHQVRVESDAGWTYMWTWDVEQTQWLRWKFTNVERMPDHERVMKTSLDGLFHTMWVARSNFYRHERSTTPSPSVTTFYQVPVDFPDLQPAPVEPPDVYLINREGDRYQWQQAILAHSDWRTPGGELVTKAASLPIDRPPPLEVPETATVVIKVVAESAPTSLLIREYGALGSDGRVVGEPVATTVWEHPKVYSYRAEENARALRYNDDEGVAGWELEVQSLSSVDVSYLMLFATWYERGRGACSANWMMSARRVGGRRNV